MKPKNIGYKKPLEAYLECNSLPKPEHLHKFKCKDSITHQNIKEH